MDKKRREYLRAYRNENRDQYNEAHRRWRSSLYGKPATAQQRKACQRNPLASLQSRYRVVKPNFVYCMLCWNPVGELGHHGCVKKSGGAGQYRERFRIPGQAALWCEKFAKSKSRVSKKKCAPHVRKWWRDNPNALSGIAKPSTWKTSARGDVLTDGMLVWAWIVEQRPIEKIAAQYQVSRGAAMRRLGRVLGFPVRRFCTTAHGEPVTKAWVRGMMGRFRLKIHELGAALGRDRNFADNLARPDQQAGVPRRATAQALARLERELLTSLLKAKGVQKPALLQAVVPDLEQRYRALLDPCSWLLSQSDADHLRSHLGPACQRSRAEVSKGGPYQWRAFLCVLPDLIAFLGDHSKWKTKWSSGSKLATGFLAADLETEVWVVSAVLSGKTESVSSDALGLLVHGALAEIKGKPRGSFGEDPRTGRRKKLAAAFMKLGWQQSEMATMVFCDTPASASTNIRSFFRDHGPAIEVMARLNLTRKQAESIVKNPREFLDLTCE